MLPSIEIEPSIINVCPELKIGMIRATVTNTPTPDALWDLIIATCHKIQQNYQLADINKRPAIAATRRLYRAFGKDPNRYRVASEALCRRAIKERQLYRINALVDLINLISMESGYPISGLDADKIYGNKLTMGIGYRDEMFEGIGRGKLNIEGLPVYRDNLSGIATPTSDAERTKISLSTATVQININAFAPEMPLDKTMAWCTNLMQEYCTVQEIETSIFIPINK